MLFVACGLYSVAQTGGEPQVDHENGKQSLDTFLQSYLGAPSPKGKDYKRYINALVDLRDDGKHEAIVYITDPDWCGTGGCTALILEPENSSYRIITETTIVHLPIRVLETKSHGWRDLGVWVQGGGIQPGYEAKLSYDGKTYPSNPSVAPATQLTKNVKGRVLLSSSMLENSIKKQPQPIHVETIVPGRSVGNLRLGMKEGDLERPVFSWQPKAQISQNEDSCHYRLAGWVNIQGNYPSVSAYVADEGVVEIIATVVLDVQGMGIVYGKKLSELKAEMPDGELLQWKGSDWRMPGGKDEFFWVVRNKGIAFGLDYDRQLRSRRVISVTIFSPRGSFHPEGCLRDADELVPVKSPGDR